jgi:hypothetical protein
MKHKFDEFMLVDSPYKPSPGMFARCKQILKDRYKIDHWLYCRELFHNHLFNLKLFFYAHARGKGAVTASFIAEVEEILDVQPRSEMGPTQQKMVMWIKPSKWWTSRGMRRSLFTILLRAGKTYKPAKNNIEEVVTSDKYLEGTSKAFFRFLEGYTKYTGHKRGWYRQFCQLKPSDEMIEKLLIRSENLAK